MLGREGVEVLRRIERVARQRRRLQRKRLRRPGLLARHAALRHRPFFDAEDRLAGDAIEDEHQRHLRHHRDRGHRLAVALDVDQRRRRRHVVVPDVVMHQLLVPFQLAGRRVERDDGVAVQVRALAIAAVVVGRRRTDRRVDDAALGVDGEERPDVGAGSVLPAVAFPRLDARLAGARDGVERPQQLAGLRVPAADVAVETGARRLLAVVAAGDDDVLVDRRRRGEAEAAVDVAADARLEIDRARVAVAEPGGRLAALGVDREQTIAGAAEQARRRVAIARPVGDAAPADRGRRACSARSPSRVSGSSAMMSFPAVTYMIAVDRRAASPAVPLTPVSNVHARCSVADVGRRDLLQRREALAAGVVIVRRPVVDVGGDQRRTRRKGRQRAAAFETSSVAAERAYAVHHVIRT